MTPKRIIKDIRKQYFKNTQTKPWVKTPKQRQLARKKAMKSSHKASMKVLKAMAKSM